MKAFHFLLTALLIAVATDGSSGLDFVLDWSTYLGGQDQEFGWSITHGADGSVFVVGETYSVDFPTTEDAFDSTPDDNEDTAEAYLVRLSPDGTHLLYGTFLGGSQHDVCRDVALDSEGNIYATGITSSFDFPVTPNAVDGTYACCNDVFLVKLNPTGTQLLYGTFLGSYGDDKARGVAVLAPDFVCVTGRTNSEDFPVTPGAFDETYNGDWDVFVTFLDLSSSEIMYSTFLGGVGREEPWDLVVDALGHAYVTGYTNSSDYPTTPFSLGPVHNGNEDGFLTKVQLGAPDLTYSTFLGGTGLDRAERLAVNDHGEAVVVGFTRSGNFPVTPGSFDETPNGLDDAFILKVGASGDSLLFSTLLGGEQTDRSLGVALGADGDIFVGGRTYSADFPAGRSSSLTDHNGSSDVFVARLDSTGSTLRGSILLGGPGWEGSYGVTLTSEFSLALAGNTDELPFPTTEGCFDPDYNGGMYDAIVCRFDFDTLASSAPAPMQIDVSPRIQVYPNPVRRQVEVSLTLDRSGWVELDLTDVNGRRVANLLRGWREQGRHQVSWAGTRDRGDLPSGIYLLRLATGSGTWGEKVLIWR